MTPNSLFKVWSTLEQESSPGFTLVQYYGIFIRKLMGLTNIPKTSMHSSRTCTDRTLTVFPYWVGAPILEKIGDPLWKMGDPPDQTPPPLPLWTDTHPATLPRQHACENITFPTSLRYAFGKNWFLQQWPTVLKSLIWIKTILPVQSISERPVSSVGRASDF